VGAEPKPELRVGILWMVGWQVVDWVVVVEVEGVVVVETWHYWVLLVWGVEVAPE